MIPKECAGLIAWAMVPAAHAFVNLDFESLIADPASGRMISVGWTHHSALGPDLDETVNLSEWSEAYVVGDGSPPLPPGALVGQGSVAFFSNFARWVTSGDQSPIWVSLGYTGNEPIGRASIGQVGVVPLGAISLTFLTDYEGPTSPDPGADPLRLDTGELVVGFGGQALAYTLEPVNVGGRDLQRGRVDLTGLGGLTGELTFGVEGPHAFTVDELRFEVIPEPGTWVAGGVVGVLGGILGCWRRRAATT